MEFLCSAWFYPLFYLYCRALWWCKLNLGTVPKKNNVICWNFSMFSDLYFKSIMRNKAIYVNNQDKCRNVSSYIAIHGFWKLISWFVTKKYDYKEEKISRLHWLLFYKNGQFLYYLFYGWISLPYIQQQVPKGLSDLEMILTTLKATEIFVSK